MNPVSQLQSTDRTEADPAPNPKLILVLSLGFVLSGIATILLGPVLPIVIARWSLTDSSAGLLFTLQFLSSTLAPIFATRNLRHSIVGGYFIMAAGIACLALPLDRMLPHSILPLILPAEVIIYSLGLGGIMTATNLAVSGIGTTGQAGRAAALARLNLAWGLGAVACPLLVSLSVRQHRFAVFLTLLSAGSFALFLLLTRFHIPAAVSSSPAPAASLASSMAAPLDQSQLALHLFFASILFLYVGMENCIGGWATTYASRIPSATLTTATLVTSCFWSGLLLGRALTPSALRRLSEPALMVLTVLLTLAGVLILFVPPSLNSLAAAIFLAGLGCGPIYPLTVSLFCIRAASTRHAGWVFASAGFGGACLPWLTGWVATRTGTLRIGFIVPAAAAALMLAAALRLRLRSQ